MKNQIGLTAGKIWNYLRDKDEVNIAAIPKALDEKALTVQMALGWLAREDKVEFRTEGAKNLVCINQSEKSN